MDRDRRPPEDGFYNSSPQRKSELVLRRECGLFLKLTLGSVPSGWERRTRQ